MQGNVNPGYFYDGFGTNAQLRECPTGSYCRGGNKIPCPPGRYGSSQKNSCPNCDGPCLGGFHCGSGSTNSAAEACAPLGVKFPEEYYCFQGYETCSLFWNSFFFFFFSSFFCGRFFLI